MLIENDVVKWDPLEKLHPSLLSIDESPRVDKITFILAFHLKS